MTEPRLALAARPHFADPNVGIHIDANENPMGPSDAARKAMVDIIPRGGRYLFNTEEELAEIFAKQEGARPGIRDSFRWLQRAAALHVLAFTSKDRPLVISPIPATKRRCGRADLWRTDSQVPLAGPPQAKQNTTSRPCSPPRPIPASSTSAIPTTPPAPARRARTSKPPSPARPRTRSSSSTRPTFTSATAPHSLDFVKEGKNVIVLRTFSKLYGMAGIRMGLPSAVPDLLAKITPFGGQNSMPITAVVAAKARSCSIPTSSPRRKKIIANIRIETLAWLKSEGLSLHAVGEQLLHARCKAGPAKRCRQHSAQKEMYVGRIWPAWPNSVRITIGTADEMMAFRKDFTAVMNSTTAGLAPAPLPRRLADHPFTHLS